jgi:CheY-like chemotaxis protein
MRILLVEDDPTYIRSIIPVLEESGDVVLACSRDSALAILETNSFDLIICDRKIPVIDGSLDTAEEHGDEVIKKCQTGCPGTPILVNTAFESADSVKRAMEESDRVDLYGSGEKFHMCRSCTKLRSDDMISHVIRHATEFRNLVDIEVVDGGILSDDQKKIIRICSRRKGFQSATVTRMSEGASGADVFKVIFTGEAGTPPAATVVKTSTLFWHFDEKNRFEKYVPGRLAIGSFPPFFDSVEAGAPDLGGLFYQLADQNCISLYDSLRNNVNGAVTAVGDLEPKLAAWNDNKHNTNVTIGDIRRILLPDDRLHDVTPHLVGIDFASFEARNVPANRVIGHLDLHGGNVLINSNGSTLIIDFGNVGESFIAIDAIYLELSLTLNTSNADIIGDWPSLDVAKSWDDLTTYIADCTVADFIIACREWAAKNCQNREVLVSAYAVSMALLRHDSIRHAVAVEIIKSVIVAFDK